MILSIIAAVLFLDQSSKFLISRNLFLHQSIPVIRGVFHLSLVHNRGAAFGMLKNQLWLFILASVSAVILASFGLKSGKRPRIYRVSLALILAGAIGNLIDRVSCGYVIDFLDFRVWPVFNLADSAITIGAVLLGYQVLTKNPGPKTQDPGPRT
ncbi:MAG: signal peptidase II [Omnitrophica WOR_2 bacterium RIFCSPLOWO2_12_FULL_51_8]|nr:MAG: signal peptidase II [Omnitrophica WOR_2 bacterium RIFCSPLOWO2_12_FULL_51_8]